MKNKKSNISKLFKYTKRLILKVYRILSRREVNLLAPYIAFFILLSFLPILTLTFEVIFLAINNNQEVLETLKEVMPTNVYNMTVRLINHNPNNVSLITISNIFLLYLASQIYQSYSRIFPSYSISILCYFSINTSIPNHFL